MSVHTEAGEWESLGGPGAHFFLIGPGTMTPWSDRSFGPFEVSGYI